MTDAAVARVGDPFGHSEATGGLLAGLAIGVLAGAASIATGGAALLVLIGAAAATAAGGGLLGESIGALFDGPTTGVILVGSPA